MNATETCHAFQEEVLIDNDVEIEFKTCKRGSLNLY